MHKPTDKEATRYVEELARLLHIDCVEPYVIVHNEGCEDRIATIEMDYEQNAAAIHIYPSFVMLSDDEQRETLAHELLHWKFGKLESLIEALAQCDADHIPDALSELVAIQLEALVDYTARLVAPAMPEIPWVGMPAA